MKQALLIFLLLPLSGLADIYKCTDKNGQVSFQHNKCQGETETIHRKSGYAILFENTGLVAQMQPRIFATVNAMVSRRADPYSASRAVARVKQQLAPDFREGGHFYKKLMTFYRRHFTEDDADRLLAAFESPEYQALLRGEQNMTREYWHAMNGNRPAQPNEPAQAEALDKPVLKKWRQVMNDHRAEYDRLFTRYIDERVMPEVDARLGRR